MYSVADSQQDIMQKGSAVLGAEKPQTTWHTVALHTPLMLSVVLDSSMFLKGFFIACMRVDNVQ